MKTKLILVEGLPGSGKSTFARRIAKHLQDKGYKAKSYNEGYAHPADFAWCAYLDMPTYHALMEEFPQYAERMREHATESQGHVIVPYLVLELGKDGRALRQKLEQYEIFDGKLTTEEFLQLHLGKWNEFCEKALSDDTIHVFECAYLQNHINEMLLHYEPTLDTIVDYFQRLIETVKPLNPQLFYLAQEDVHRNIRWISDLRVTDDPDEPNWIDHVTDHLADTPYGRSYGLKDMDGVCDYATYRQEKELQVIKELDIPSSILYKEEGEWDQLFSRVIGRLDKIID